MLVTNETGPSLRPIPFIREYLVRLVDPFCRNDQSDLRDPRSSASFGEGLADRVPIGEAHLERCALGTTDGIKGIEEYQQALDYNRV
jgi:hypothetical protein